MALLAQSGLAVEKRFDCAALCCDCAEEHFCETHFDHLNSRTPGGHYLVMGTDSHRAKVVGNGNALAAYYDTLTEGWKKMTGAAKAEVIHKAVLKNYTKTGPRPEWLVINEISAGMWPEEPNYRKWLVEVLATLKTKYRYSVVVCAPFTHPGAHDTDWQAVSANAYVGIECYLSGKLIMEQTNSVEWCEKMDRAAKTGFEKRGVPAAKLFLVEHFASTGPEKAWGRSGVTRAEWEKALYYRAQAAHKVVFAGFVSYAWGRNAMQASEEEVLRFEDIYSQQRLP